MTNLTEITEPLREAWNGTGVELIDVMRHIAENVEMTGSDAFYDVVPRSKISEDTDLWDEVAERFDGDRLHYGYAIVAKAFYYAATALETQMLEDGTCPACGGALTSDGYDRESSTWCSQCGKVWT